MRRVLVAAAMWCAVCVVPAGAQVLPELSYTRLLRKITLTLRGRIPTPEEYQAVLDAPDDATRELLIGAAITDALDSPEFYELMVVYGRDLVGAVEYGQDLQGSNWKGSRAIPLDVCGDDTLHAGRLGIFSNYPQYGDSPEWCDDPEAPVYDVEPWWAPGTTLPMIGWAGAEHSSIPDPANAGESIDCGVLREQFTRMAPPNPTDGTAEPRCGCGPNLIYCARRGHTPSNALAYDAFYNDLTSQRRAFSDEAARLFAHLVVNDRPLTDLVLGTYTVANQALQHAYIRAARQSGTFAYLDTDPWWQSVTDPDEWREVTVADMYPVFTSERSVLFDPRVDFGEVPPLPSAGVLTMRGALAAPERERPRAARWLERFACRRFTPPPVEVDFVEFDTDPATEGPCQVCHQLIDPAAMHFKRFSSNGARVAGFGLWRWVELATNDADRLRWLEQYNPNTVMTPVTEVDMIGNPDARFLDFAPAGTTLLGETSDGTIGPLGFAKMLVSSGEFDRCMVRRLYNRFGGIHLNPAVDSPFIESLVSDFTTNNRNVRSLIQAIVTNPRFRAGR